MKGGKSESEGWRRNMGSPDLSSARDGDGGAPPATWASVSQSVGNEALHPLKRPRVAASSGASAHCLVACC